MFVSGYLIVVRPYKYLQGNLIEAVNQTIFMTLVWFLFFLTKPSQWNYDWELTFLCLVTANNLIVVLIVLSE